jgi:tRNA pseudouridine38-40 synthase
MDHRIKLVVAYLGCRFHGWQRQPDRRTVQGEVERAIGAMLDGVDVSVIGAGRTDAGVHAAAQVAHCDLPTAIPPDSLFRGLNRTLPREIRIRSVRQVTPAFHARKGSRAKRYTYRARWQEAHLPWQGLRTATVEPVTDEHALTAAVRRLMGRQNVASFTVPDAAVGSTVRTLYRVVWRRHRFGIDLEFVGDGFLRYQVRRMVAALLAVARRQMTIDQFGNLLDRPEPGYPLQTAAARGLTLERVYYRTTPLLRHFSED